MAPPPEAAPRGSDVLILADSFYEDTPYDRWAADAAVTPWLLVSGEKYPGYAHLPHVWSFPGWWGNGAVEQAALRLGASLNLRAIVARSEPDILRAARLREALGVPGQTWASAVAFRDKVTMKNLLAANGVRVPAFASIRCATDLLGFIAERGYPVIVKPVRRSGSVDSHVLRAEDDLTSLLEVPLSSEMEVEEYVAGDVYAIDGFVTDDVVVGAFPAAYVNDCLSYTRGMYHGMFLLSQDHRLRARLVALARRVLASLPAPASYAFHIEVFHASSGELVVCEAASRTAGGRANALIHYATGIDMDRAWWDAQVGVSSGPIIPRPARSAGYVMVYSKGGVLAALPEELPTYVVDCRITGQVGSRYDPPVKSGNYFAAYVVEGETEGSVAERIHEVGRWFDAGARWE